MDNLLLAEKDKYQKIWEIDSYRKYSPAMKHVIETVDRCKQKGFNTILDAGCGTGRATEAFITAGLMAVGIDITLTAVDPKIREKYPKHFYEECLWSIEDNVPPFDLVFCVDVLEHIPLEMLNDTMQCLSILTTHEFFAKISLVKDSYGKLISQDLNLSIYHADYWITLFKKYYQSVEIIENKALYITLRGIK